MGANALKECNGEPEGTKEEEHTQAQRSGKRDKKKERETKEKMRGKVLSLSDIREQSKLADRYEDDSKK